MGHTTGKTPKEWVIVAEVLAANNGGILPNCNWLINNGYRGLDNSKRNNPQLFAHIKQKVKRKSVDKQVAIAERLAADNDNLLQSPGWLQKNGYNDLDAVMRRHVSKFSHIKQDSKKGKTVSEWVIFADQLVVENDGVLPCSVKNIHGGLAGAMYNHPELFSHITTTAQQRTQQEWVSYAKTLIDKNGGVLPSYSQLRDTGHIDLANAMYNHPDFFVGIEQYSLLKSPEEHVIVANRLVADNGGTLYCYSELIKRGYKDLTHALNNHPHLFAHITQDSMIRTPEEWVPIAENLAVEHGGKLPGARWMCASGNGGMASAMENNPELFEHIEQVYLGGTKLKENIEIANRLAEENNGVIPSASSLKDIGHQSLVSSMQLNKNLYSHFKQNKETNTPEEWVLIAEKMAEENGGMLPIATWLQENMPGLLLVIRNNKELFDHIEMDRGVGGFIDTKPGVLYLFKFLRSFNKIGISNDVVKRIRNLTNQTANGTTHSIVGGGYYVFPIGLDARNLEHKIKTHPDFKTYKYDELLLTEFDGRTELFIKSAFSEITAFIKKHAPDAEYVPF